VRLKRVRDVRDSGVAAGHERGQLIQLRQDLAEQESVMRGEASSQGFGELLHFGCQAASGEAGQPCGVRLAGDQGIEHRPTGYTEDVADDVAQLDIGAFQ
jgi:hypothetical protein